jgi:predicted RNA binding protein YcfA (HicA-like mRNA interferase family)
VKAVSGKDLCKVLKRKGWRCVRINGSHHVYSSADGTRKVSVPVHGNKSLRTGTQHTIMKDAGLTEADL